MCAFSGKTHLAIGLIIWFFFPVLNLPILLIGTLFPDTDHRKSILGRIIPLWILGFKHRGLTHTIWFAAIFSLICEGFLKGMGISFFIGYVSHLIGDRLK